MRRKLIAITVCAMMMMGAVPSFGVEKLSKDVQPSDTTQIIAVYDTDTSSKEIRADAKEVGTVEDIEKTEENKIALIDLDISYDEAEQALDENENVIYSQPNRRYEAKTQTDPYLADPTNLMYQYQLDAVNAENAWTRVESQENHGRTTVAVIDTGCDVKHADLQKTLVVDGKSYQQFACGKQESVDDDIDTYYGHGTHTTGIVGATYGNGEGGSGIASGHDNDLVRVLPISASYNGNSLYTYDICKAIKYAVENGAKVISMSFGDDQKDIVLKETIDRYYAQGVVFVAASGNDESDGFSSPADYRSVIAVNASTKNGTAAYYSDYGNLKDITAPGTDILSTIGGSMYGMMSGTSMATPIVSGVCALMLDVNPDLTPDQVRNILCMTSNQNGRFNKYLAYGIVDAEKAVQAAQNATTTTIPTAIDIKEGNTDTNTVTISKGKSLEMTASVIPAESLTKVTWETSNSQIVKIDENGIATGVEEGKAVITARAGSASTTCDVLVTSERPALQSLSLSLKGLDDNTVITQDNDEGVFVFEAVPYPEDADTEDVSFKSSDESILFVDSIGAWHTFDKTGTVEVTATDEKTGIKGTLAVNVRVDAEKVEFTSAKKNIRVGDTFTFTAKAKAETEGEIYRPEIKYTTSNANGTIDEKTGAFKAKKAGYCFVIASLDNGVKKVFKVNILKNSYSGKDYGLKAKKSGKKATLTWKKQLLAKSYQIQQKIDGKGWKTVKSVKTAKCTCKIKKGHTYKYRVRAKYTNSGKTGYYGWSNTRTVKAGK